MMWPQTLLELAGRDEPFVVVTVASTRGSTPREAGAKMFVTPTHTVGSIGGGQLEYDCTAMACKWFREESPAQTFSRRFTLGADCGQCCGGVAEILFEQVIPKQLTWLAELRAILSSQNPAIMVTAGDSRTGVTKRLISAETAFAADDTLAHLAVERLTTNGPPCRITVALAGNVEVPALFEPLQTGQFEIVLFGAGHVGSALVASLATLPCHVTWVDSRPTAFPANVPDNVTAVHLPDPATLIDTVGSGCYFVVMTHSHTIDLQICAQILSRDDFVFCGLIGSQSKRRQFEKRLGALGLSDRQLQRLTCPIGIDGISGKKPAEIAVSTAAQLLQVRESELAIQRPVTSPLQLQHRR